MNAHTQRTGALVLAALMTLQGCSAVAPRDVAGAPATIEGRLEGAQAERGATTLLLPRAGALPASGLEPTCGQFFKLSDRDGVLLGGFLLLASPFLLLYAVISAPLELVRDRM